MSNSSVSSWCKISCLGDTESPALGCDITKAATKKKKKKIIITIIAMTPIAMTLMEL